jgi:hypothetical protein
MDLEKNTIDGVDHLDSIFVLKVADLRKENNARAWTSHPRKGRSGNDKRLRLCPPPSPGDRGLLS